MGLNIGQLEKQGTGNRTGTGMGTGMGNGNGNLHKTEETTAPRSLFTNSSSDDSATVLTAILFTN